MLLAVRVMVGITLDVIGEDVHDFPDECGGIKGEGPRVIAVSVVSVSEMVIRGAAGAVGRAGLRVEPDGRIVVVDRAAEVMLDMAGRAAVPIRPDRAQIRANARS